MRKFIIYKTADWDSYDLSITYVSAIDKIAVYRWLLYNKGVAEGNTFFLDDVYRDTLAVFFTNNKNHKDFWYGEYQPRMKPVYWKGILDMMSSILIEKMMKRFFCLKVENCFQSCRQFIKVEEWKEPDFEDIILF